MRDEDGLGVFLLCFDRKKHCFASVVRQKSVEAEADCIDTTVILWFFPLACAFTDGCVTQIHYRRTLHVEEFVAKNAGLLALFPPVAYDEDFENRFEWEEKIVEVMGTTWMVAAGDIVIAGLGWVAVTLKGKMIVRVRVPKGVLVTFRPSLLPYESVYGAGFYTGFVWRNFYKERKLGREKSWFAGHKPPGVHYVNVEEKRLLLARRFVQ